MNIRRLIGNNVGIFSCFRNMIPNIYSRPAGKANNLPDHSSKTGRRRNFNEWNDKLRAQLEDRIEKNVTESSMFDSLIESTIWFFIIVLVLLSSTILEMSEFFSLVFFLMIVQATVKKTYVVAVTQFFIKVYGNMNILWSQFLWYLKFVISSKLFTTIIYSVKLIAYVIVFTAVSLGTLSPEYLWLVLIELVLNELRKGFQRNLTKQPSKSDNRYGESDVSLQSELTIQSNVLEKLKFQQEMDKKRYEKIIEEQASKIKELTEKQEQQRQTILSYERSIPKAFQEAFLRITYLSKLQSCISNFWKKATQKMDFRSMLASYLDLNNYRSVLKS